MSKLDCDDCGFHAKSEAGLASHRRSKHPEVEVGPNARALEVTLSELVRLGRLEDIDSAEVQVMRSLAQAVDWWPSDAQLWRQYREALREVTDADDGGEFDQLLEALGSVSTVGDAKAS